MNAAASNSQNRLPAKANAAGVPSPSLESVTTIQADGSRLFLHPADVHGLFTTARRLSALGLMAVYILLPWIKIGGYPAVFLDLADRRFHLFGWTLAAQDLWLLFFLISGLGFTLFFVTALLGRIWCGWACPQTVFLEHAFRRVERWLEGSGLERRALDAAPWSARKIILRGLKHLIYLGFAAAIAHVFLSYFVSLPALWSMMRAAPGAHGGAFLFIAAATGVLYFNFAWFREQLCIVICPYGRLQSALIDDHSLVIGYSVRRGEPRGRLGTRGAGDCVDCSRCVQVCPTGIDIRQGLQIECIGCAACIDACDEVMHKIHRPAGLIRYASQASLAGRKTRWLRPRIFLYAVLLLAGSAAAAWAFSTLKPASFGVTRLTGAPYFVDPDFVRNEYLVRLVNKQSSPANFSVQIYSDADIEQIGLTEPVTVPALGEEVRPLVLRVSRAHYTGPFPVTIILSDAPRTFYLERTVNFLGPDAELLQEEDHEKGIQR
ncbi:MAG TPA: cytochrome c oxidase accessory protein CcoG [Opitutaceae bacterium]|nr:cytochrome c oxidase accessory protein CcoG [Opitutaceae bacterium]